MQVMDMDGTGQCRAMVWIRGGALDLPPVPPSWHHWQRLSTVLRSDQFGSLHGPTTDQSNSHAR